MFVGDIYLEHPPLSQNPQLSFVFALLIDLILASFEFLVSTPVRTG